MKILLVDDDSFVRDMYAVKFKEAGHTVESIGNPMQAIEYLKMNTVDVILLDMIMPGMTGVEVLAKITADKLGGTPKCIVLSNQGEESDIKAAQAAGAIGYIVKAEMIPSEVVHKVESVVK